MNYILGLDKDGARIATYLESLHYETLEQCKEEILKIEGVVKAEVLTEEEYESYVDIPVFEEDVFVEEAAAENIEVDNATLLELLADLYEKVEGI
ncbi:hypothetical protein [Veillonella intestinalis]|uniref:hypothetical protein n=1 Tax=Veillonella intestinalis TaxID=2941341 RepID=UPI00203BF680|nr:hypothetical protein [Veillonella intestinalis]